MKNYPVQIIGTIQNKDNSIISNFIKSIDYKIIGKGRGIDDKSHFIQYTFSYKNAVKFIKLLQDLGYLFEIKLYVKKTSAIPIYE